MEWTRRDESLPAVPGTIIPKMPQEPSDTSRQPSGPAFNLPFEVVKCSSRQIQSSWLPF